MNKQIINLKGRKKTQAVDISSVHLKETWHDGIIAQYHVAT